MKLPSRFNHCCTWTLLLTFCGAFWGGVFCIASFYTRPKAATVSPNTTTETFYDDMKAIGRDVEVVLPGGKRYWKETDVKKPVVNYTHK